MQGTQKSNSQSALFLFFVFSFLSFLFHPSTHPPPAAELQPPLYQHSKVRAWGGGGCWSGREDRAYRDKVRRKVSLWIKPHLTSPHFKLLYHFPFELQLPLTAIPMTSPRPPNRLQINTPHPTKQTYLITRVPCTEWMLCEITIAPLNKTWRDQEGQQGGEREESYFLVAFT